MKTLIIALLLIAAPGAHAAIYYVATTGGGSTCSLAQPCATVAAGLSKMASGDTLIIGNGTYNEAITYNQLVSGGNNSSRTVIMAANPKGAILQCTVCASSGPTDYGFIIWVYGKSWITFDGLVLDGGNRAVQDGPIFYGNADGSTYPRGITLTNSEIKNGLDILGSACVAIEGRDNVVSHNIVHNCDGTGSPAGAHGIYIGSEGTGGDSNAIVEFNEVYDVTYYGIHLYHTYINHAKVRYNYVHDNKDGILVSLGTDNRVYGNVVVNNTDSGITAYSESNAAVIGGNTIFNSGICISLTGATDTIIQNNLCLSNSTNSIQETSSSGTTTCASCNVFSTDNTLLVDVATTHNFHIRNSGITSLINQGVNLSSYFTTDRDGISLPQGAGYDIGAYEYVTPLVAARRRF